MTTFDLHMCVFSHCNLSLLDMYNISFEIIKKEGNDQESIQLPNTFRPRHLWERRTHLKQRHHNQNTTSRKPKGQFLSRKRNGQTASRNKNVTRTYMQRHTITEIVNHSRSTAWNGQQNFTGWLKSILRGHNPRP